MWSNKTNRLVRVFTPFFLLLVGVIVVNFTIEDLIIIQQTPVPGTATIVDRPQNEVTNTPRSSVGGLEPISTAIANATEMPKIAPVPISDPTPTMFPREIITLTGPPEDSRFSISAPLSFYWFSDKQLSAGETFKLFLMNDSNEKLVGTLSEPNMGSAFQINFIPENSGISPGEYYWRIAVSSQEGDRILGESEQRLITLVDTEE